MRRAGLLVWVGGLAVLLAGAMAWGVPWLTRDRDYLAAVPQPPPLLRLAEVRVPAGATACWGPVVVDTRSERAALIMHTGGRRGVPLELTLRGPGWTARSAIRGGYADNAVVTADVTPPRRDVAAEVCVRNAGQGSVALRAADDRTKAPLDARVDGRVVRTSPVLSFHERARRSLAERLPLSLDRMDTFRFGFVGPWLLWTVLVLVALGVPAAVLWGCARSLREPD